MMGKRARAFCENKAKPFAESGFSKGFQRSNREKTPADAHQLKVDGAIARAHLLPATKKGKTPELKKNK
jgi:hypothetical protein